MERSLLILRSVGKGSKMLLVFSCLAVSAIAVLLGVGFSRVRSRVKPTVFFPFAGVFRALVTPLVC